MDAKEDSKNQVRARAVAMMAFIEQITCAVQEAGFYVSYSSETDDPFAVVFQSYRDQIPIYADRISELAAQLRELATGEQHAKVSTR